MYEDDEKDDGKDQRKRDAIREAGWKLKKAAAWTSPPEGFILARPTVNFQELS
jgi:hypothetical protein